MDRRFRKQSSSLFVTIFIGLIVVSFIFTGHESLQGRPDAVANVNGHSVTFPEFQNEYQRMLEFYKNMMGGETLNSRQIEMMNVKQTALNNLIQRKVLFDLGQEMELAPGPEEVKDSIKSLPYFLTGKAFDLGKYKGILAANGLSPSEFEESQREALTVEKVQNLLGLFPLSTSFSEAIENFRGQKFRGHLVNIRKGVLASLIPVSKAEIDSFLKDEVNARRVQSLFQDRRESLASEDGQEAKYDEHKGALARELIQRSKSSQEEDKILANIKEEVAAAFKKRGRPLTRELKRLERTYPLTVDTDTEINRYDGPTGQVALTREQVASLFEGDKGERTETFEDGPGVVMVKLGPATKEKSEAQAQPTSLEADFSRKFRAHIVETLQKDASVNINSRAIQ